MPRAATRTRLLVTTRGSGLGGPTYLGNFLLGSLPSGVTVSSPSLGGLVTDASGKLTYKPNNLLVQSNTFSNAAWNKSNVTLAAGVADPLGGTAATRVTATANTGFIYQNPTPPGAFVSAIWVRRVSGTGSVNLWTNAGVTGQAINPTSTWQQFYVSYASGTGFTGVILGTSGDVVDVYAATLSAVTYETAPRPGDQVITTSSAYYGPAFDYDPVSVGTPLGLRVWESRTNLVKFSGQLNNAGWSNAGNGTPTIAVSGTMAPDGSSMFQFTLATTYGEVSVASPSSAGTASIYVKQGTTPNVYLADAGGSAATYTFGSGWSYIGTWSGGTITTLPNGLIRISAYNSNSAPSKIAFGATGTVGQTILLWGAQYEAAATASPYTPTSSAAVTAAADVVTLGGVPLGVLQGAAWSAIAEFQSAAASSPLLQTGPVSSGSFSNMKTGRLDWFATGQALGTYAVGTTAREAAGWSGGKYSGVLAGGTVFTGSTDFTNTGVTTAALGSYSGAYLNGYIRKLALWNSRLPDATLQAKTVSGATF